MFKSSPNRLCGKFKTKSNLLEHISTKHLYILVNWWAQSYTAFTIVEGSQWIVTKDRFESLHQCSNPVQIVAVTKRNLLVQCISTKQLYMLVTDDKPVIYCIYYCRRFRLVRHKNRFESLHQCSNPVQIVCVTKSNLLESIFKQSNCRYMLENWWAQTCVYCIYYCRRFPIG